MEEHIPWMKFQSLHRPYLRTNRAKYLVPMKWHVTVFPSPLLQVRGLERVIRGHVDGREDVVVAVVGAVQEEERHQDEDDHKDHHPVALLPLQCTECGLT